MHADLDRFLAHLSERPQPARPNTMAAYRTDLTQLLDFLSARAPTPLRLRVWAASLPQRGYKSASVARKIAAARSFCGWLVAQERAAPGLADVLVAPRRSGLRMRTLTADQARALVAAVEARPGPEGLRDRAVIAVLRATGVRVSELARLDTADVDLPSRTLRAAAASGYPRDLPLDRETAEALSTYLTDARPRLVRYTGTDALFVNHRGDRLTRQGIWLTLKAHGRAAGLPAPLSTHVLRASLAVDLLADGADVGSVQKLLGHANVATTQRYAAVVGERRERRVA